MDHTSTSADHDIELFPHEDGTATIGIGDPEGTRENVHPLVLEPHPDRQGLYELWAYDPSWPGSSRLISTHHTTGESAEDPHHIARQALRNMEALTTPGI